MAGLPVTSPRLPWDELASIVPLRPASPADAILGVAPQQIVEPRTPEETAAILRWADALHVAVAPRGGGSKLEWGNTPRALDLLISTRAMNRVLEHAWEDLTVTVEPGCTVADLQRTLAEHRQRLALDPLFPEQATIGGILATNDSGALRTRFGSLRDLIIGITAALPDGTVARSGGKVVKNVAGYDLPKLFTGSFGTLGVIAQATFRLHPLPAETRTLSFQCASVKDANAAIIALQNSTLVHTSLQLRAARERATSLDIRFEGTRAGIDAQVDRASKLVTGTAVEPSSDVWRMREELWMQTGPACVCRFSVLPSQLAETCTRIDHLASELHLDWRAIAQAVGVGLVRIDGAPPQLATAVGHLREDLENAGGSITLLHCPQEIRSRVDTWGAAGSALPLMQRMKQQFDPDGIMNPGRFVGGI